jgi:hypothetical protein
MLIRKKYECLPTSSVPSQKLVVYIGELSAALARRADDRISGIFRGGPTPPASSRAVEIYNELLGRNTRSPHRSCRFLRILVLFLCLLLPSLTLLVTPGYTEDEKLQSEEAQFDIFVDGKNIGEEKYSIAASRDTITSHSVVNFRNPGNRRQKVQMETELSMDIHYLPQTYQLRTNVDGQKGTISGKLVPGEATFEYRGTGNPRTRGLMVGDRFIVLDTNVFHHYIFVVRLFDFSIDKPQSIEVVIPQELDGGVLKIREIGIERLSTGGKKRDLHHLKVDSGLLQIDLWVDDQQTLYKIALPAKQIEVIRKS